MLRTRVGAAVAAPAPALVPAPDPARTPQALADPRSVAALVELVGARGEKVLYAQLKTKVQLVKFEPGLLELQLPPELPRDFTQRLGQRLGEWTGRRWMISIAGSGGAPTLREQADQRERSLVAVAAEQPIVRAVLAAFPGAVIERVRELAEAAEPGTDPSVDPPPDEFGDPEDPGAQAEDLY